jgi:hypothetical protein
MIFSLSELLVPTFRVFEQFDWAPRNQNCKTNRGFVRKDDRFLGDNNIVFRVWDSDPGGQNTVRWPITIQI